MRTHPWQPAGKVVGSPKIRFDLHVRHDTPGTKEERSLLKIRANLPGENFEHRGPTPGPVCVSNVVAKFDGQIFSALEDPRFVLGGSGGVSPLVARGGATLLMAGTCPWQERARPWRAAGKYGGHRPGRSRTRTPRCRPFGGRTVNGNAHAHDLPVSKNLILKLLKVILYINFFS